jgi:hypothetical protein
MEGPTQWEQALALATWDERVRAALDDLAGELDFPRLRRVYETVWTELDRNQSTADQKRLVWIEGGEAAGTQCADWFERGTGAPAKGVRETKRALAQSKRRFIGDVTHSCVPPTAASRRLRVRTISLTEL